MVANAGVKIKTEKFIVQSGLLLKALKRVSPVIKTNVALPIMGDFHLSAKGEKLFIMATDLETTLKTEVNITGTTSDFSICIPSKIFLDVLSNLGNQSITIEVNPKNWVVHIKTTSGKYKIAGENPKDFPYNKSSADYQGFRISGHTLKTALDSTLYATSNEEMEVALKGVLIKVEEDEVYFVTTNKNMLSELKTSLSSGFTGSFIIPNKSASILKRELDGTLVSVLFSENNAKFLFEGFEMVCMLIDATFPNYKSFLPADTNRVLTVNKELLKSAVNRVYLFSKNTSTQIILHISEDEIKLKAQDLALNQDATESVPCEYKGEPIDISFNGKNTLETINAIDCEEIEMMITGFNRPVKIRAKDESDNYKLMQILMPLILIKTTK